MNYDTVLRLVDEMLPWELTDYLSSPERSILYVLMAGRRLAEDDVEEHWNVIDTSLTEAFMHRLVYDKDVPTERIVQTLAKYARSKDHTTRDYGCTMATAFFGAVFYDPELHSDLFDAVEDTALSSDDDPISRFHATAALVTAYGQGADKNFDPDLLWRNLIEGQSHDPDLGSLSKAHLAELERVKKRLKPSRDS